MMTKKTGIGRQLPFLLAVACVAYAGLVRAQPSGADTITEIGDSRANLSAPANQLFAQAGNVTELNIEATTITKAWQGYYGNITGSITLENSAGNVFYNWSGLDTMTGEVYASRNDSVQWSTVNCTNEGNNTAENTFLGKTATDPDSLQNTFNQNNHPSFLVGTTNITQNSCNSTNTYTNTGQDTTRFYQVLLQDDQSHVVYSTIIDENQVGFDGRTFDFELLVGENGNETEEDTATTYYFYIELN